MTRRPAHHAVDDQPAASDAPADETPPAAAGPGVLVTVKANLAFADIGQTVTVDPDDPEIRALIANGVLEEQ